MCNNAIIFVLYNYALDCIFYCIPRYLLSALAYIFLIKNNNNNNHAFLCISVFTYYILYFSISEFINLVDIILGFFFLL